MGAGEYLPVVIIISQGRHFSLTLLEEEVRSLTRLGIVLIVENNSGFTLADQKIYLDDGGRGSQYVLPVKTSLFVFPLGLVRLLRSGPTTQRSSFSIICVRAARTPLEFYLGRSVLEYFLIPCC